MHELSITTEVVNIVSNRLKEWDYPKVKRVVVEVGKLTAILPDAMLFCFDLCSKGTPVEGATLNIIEVAAHGLCKSCSREIRSEQPYVLCECGSADIDWRSGQELRIKELEVE